LTQGLFLLIQTMGGDPYRHDADQDQDPLFSFKCGTDPDPAPRQK